jgi:FtsP/CotA-like multicopper oxidase with cupredoxin domain
MIISRRKFVAGSLAAGLTSAFAADGRAEAPKLKLLTRTIEVNGRAATAFGVDGATALNLMAGGRFEAVVENGLNEASILHWHGQTPPSDQDGVPMLSQDAIAPGASYGYEFDDLRAGTHWMHSHVGLQEQLLLAAPMIVRTAEETRADLQEHVVMLHDFTFRNPREILAELQKGGGAHAAHAAQGHAGHGQMPQGGGMTPNDAMLNDIVYDAYLANDRTLANPEIVWVERGGRIKLRIINAATASNIWIDLGPLKGTLIAVDGNPIMPVEDSLFPLAIAQRADIVIDIKEGAWPILFRPEGVTKRTGLILAAKGAAISKVSEEGEAAPALDLAFEARLRALKPLRPEPLSRTEMVMLTGGGADYLWGLNGKASMHETLFSVKPNERVGIMMHNMTNMAHPMHLHGHHFQVVEVNGMRFDGAMRDTVLVPPLAAVTVAFDADNPGTWAFHCHHIYHMNAGMMGAVAYTSAA